MIMKEVSGHKLCMISIIYGVVHGGKMMEASSVVATCSHGMKSCNCKINIFSHIVFWLIVQIRPPSWGVCMSNPLPLPLAGSVSKSLPLTIDCFLRPWIGIGWRLCACMYGDHVPHDSLSQHAESGVSIKSSSTPGGCMETTPASEPLSCKKV